MKSFAQNVATKMITKTKKHLSICNYAHLATTVVTMSCTLSVFHRLSLLKNLKITISSKYLEEEKIAIQISSL